MYKYIKRFADVSIALIGLIVLLPVLFIVAVWIKLDSRGPVLFRQQRYGKHRKVFNMYKFRSMRTDTPKHMPPNKFKNATSYITTAGRILRKTSLDELPQLFNIIRGDMSFVGPRPGSAMNEEELAIERDKRNVFDVLPGITGWAQVNGRDELAHNIEEKAYMDSLYVKNFGIKMDILCILRTAETVFLMQGYQEGSAEDIVESEKRKLAAAKTRAGLVSGYRLSSVVALITRPFTKRSLRAKSDDRDASSN